MKRIINLLMAVALSVVLVACGGGDNSTEETSVNNEPVNDNFNEEFDYVDMLRQEYGEDVSITDLDEDDLIALEEDEIMELLNDNETVDAKDIMTLGSDYDTFIAIDDYDIRVFEVKERYTSEETDDDGITDVDIMDRSQVDSDEETFDYEFGLMYATDSVTDENYLLFAGNVENNTEKRVQFNHDFDVIMRDIKEEDSTYGGAEEDGGLIDAYEPEFDAEGWFAFEVESEDVPEELEIKFERAWDSDGDGGTGDDDEYLEIDFEMIGEGNEANDDGQEAKEEPQEEAEETEETEEQPEEEQQEEQPAEETEEQTGDDEGISEDYESYDLEETDYIRQLKDKYGEGVTLSDLTEEEEME